jgi:hypothetical protein
MSLVTRIRGRIHALTPLQCSSVRLRLHSQPLSGNRGPHVKTGGRLVKHARYYWLHWRKDM